MAMATPTRRRSALQEILNSSPLSVVIMPDHNNGQLEDSLIDSPNMSRSSFASPAPSPDEMIIRQRGRRSISVNWSPPKCNNNNNNHHQYSNNNNSKAPNNNSCGNATGSGGMPKSPAKTPTKNNLNPQLQMVLRSSPRKRLLLNSSNGAAIASAMCNGMNASHSSPPGKLLESTKRLRINERPMAQRDSKVPLAVYLKGYTNEQLMDIILNQLIRNDATSEKRLRDELPLPDIRPMEQQLCHLKKNIYRSLPSSRLVKKNDSAAFSRASIHLISFKAAIVEHATVLSESKHYDALLDYSAMAWQYVRGTPVWENHTHNSVRRHCFKILSYHCKGALQSGGIFLGAERIRNFVARIQDMQTDCDSITSCGPHIDYLMTALENNDI